MAGTPVIFKAQESLRGKLADGMPLSGRENRIRDRISRRAIDRELAGERTWCVLAQSKGLSAMNSNPKRPRDPKKAGVRHLQVAAQERHSGDGEFPRVT